MVINTKKYIEKMIKIKNKNSEIVPLILNEPQMRLYNLIKQLHQEKKPIRIIILKARQMGFSTCTEGILFKQTVTNFNVKTGIITHLNSATTNLFNMSKTMYNNLPEEMKPALMKSNANELIFNNKNDTGLNSTIKCMTAGSSGVGRSDTFNNLHISEFAFWPGDKKTTMDGLLQAVPNTPDSMIIIESTANGFDYFKSLWDMAVNGENDFVPLFVGWNELQDYRKTYSGFELTDEEKELQLIYNLDLDQLEWRRWCIKNNCGGSVDTFKQEYPINPLEAFIGTGTSVFDKEKIIQRIELLKKKENHILKKGKFIYKLKNEKPCDIKWVNEKNGPITIYQMPDSPSATKYLISADTSGDGSDWNSAHVLDAKTGNQCAVLDMQIDEVEWTKQYYCLGIYYKWAMLAPETNFSTYCINKLIEWEYPNIYQREKRDASTNELLEKKLGYNTNKITRPNLITGLVEVTQEHLDTINDIPTLKEMLVFIRNPDKKGRPEAMEGEHDDHIMALGIGWDVKDQVTFEQEIIVPNTYDEFDLDDEWENDGYEIEVI